MGNPPQQEYIEQARKILIEANIKGLRVVPVHTHHEQLKIDDKSLVDEGTLRMNLN